MNRRPGASRFVPSALLAGTAVAFLLGPIEGAALQDGPDSTDGAGREVGAIPLTLADAIVRATGHNPAFQRLWNTAALSPLERREWWLDLLPRPQVNLLNTNINWIRRTTAEDFFGEPVPREVVEWVETSRSTQGFGLGFSLDLANFVHRRRQEEQALVRELAVETGGHGLRAQVARAFLDVQESQAVLGLEEELLETARVSRDLARELYRLGLRDRIDVVTLELEFVEQTHTLEESRAALEMMRSSLRSVIGDPTLEEFEIVPAELSDFDPQALDLARLLEVARTSGPGVREAQANLRMTERDASLVRTEWLPSVTFGINAQRQDFVRGGDAFFNPSPGGGWDGNVGLTVGFPDLGQYFRRRIDRQRTEIEIANSRETLRETSNQLEQDVRTLVHELRSRSRILEVERRRADLAGERLELARAAYRLGQESSLELQSAQEQAARANRQLLAARFAFERARIELERGTGMTIEGMLELGRP